MSGGSPGLYLGLVALLLCSASCSSSETALFSLDRTERARAGALAERLLQDPRGLLITVLGLNLVTNLAFFTFAARLSIGPEGPVGHALAALCALVAMLVFGEIVPKTVALHARVGLARLCAPGLAFLVGLSRPLRRGLDAVLDALQRALGEHGAEEVAVTPAVLAEVLERTAERGELALSEAEILTEIVELREVRVRELMRPRVDCLFVDEEGAGRDALVARALAERISTLIVYDETHDRVVGAVRLRDLLRRPDATPRELCTRVPFVPEVASALDLLGQLRAEHAVSAIVVDEWGGTAGLATLEHVFEEIVGDLRIEGEERAKPVVPLGEGRYRVAGELAVRDWNELFGRRVVPTEFETVGGLVMALCGRIPRQGDVVETAGLVFEVCEVRGRRVRSVDVWARPDADVAGGAP